MRFSNPLLLASFGVLFVAASCTLITDVDRSKIPDGVAGSPSGGDGNMLPQGGELGIPNGGTASNMGGSDSLGGTGNNNPGGGAAGEPMTAGGNGGAGGDTVVAGAGGVAGQPSVPVAGAAGAP